MLLHLNSCKSRLCLFLVFKSRFEPLQCSTEQLGENAPETADLYFSYGKALLENAIMQSSVLGREQREDAVPEDNKGNVVDCRLNLAHLSLSSQHQGLAVAPMLLFYHFPAMPKIWMMAKTIPSICLGRQPL